MEKIYLGSLAGAIDKNNVLWMSNVFFNGLFCLDLNSSEIHFLGAFDEADLGVRDLHIGAYVNDSEIIFTPFFDRAIRIYHSKAKTFQTIWVPNEHKPPFSNSIKIGQSIYFLSEDGIVWNYDIQKHTLTEDYALSMGYKKFLDFIGNRVTTKNVDVNGFSILESGGQYLCKINIIEHEVETISINDNLKKLDIAYYDGKLYWFFLNDSQDVASWDREKNEYVCYRCIDDKWAKEKFKTTPYARIAFAENNIWISNYNAYSPVKINKEKKCVEPIKQFEKNQIINPSDWGPIYTNMYFVEYNILFLPYSGRRLLYYNCESENIRMIEMSVPREEITYADEILRDSLRHGIVTEGEGIYMLSEFVKSIKKCSPYSSEHVKQDMLNSGKFIWENIKESGF